MNLLFVAFIRLIYMAFSVFKIKRNKIVLSNFCGKGYGDNGKYIVEELLQRGLDYDIVWLVKDLNEEMPHGVRKVKSKSLKSIYEQATAHIWIDNRRKPLYVRKRKQQFYIMTWHSNIALKRVEKDVESKLSKAYVKNAKHDSKMIDVFLSGSKWETNCIRNSFWYDGKVLEIGYPRQDIFINNNANTIDIINKVRNYYGIRENTNILLYAPTFRRSQNEESLSVYNLKWAETLCAFEKRFGGEWVGMIRLHPNVSRLRDKLNIPINIIDVTAYNDMQELILSCDCLITDYSSTIMEAGIANKYGFIYASDIDEYNKDRSSYFDLTTELPFPFAPDNETLIDNILKFDTTHYFNNLHKFLKNDYGVFCKGNASKTICSLIENKINDYNIES